MQMINLIIYFSQVFYQDNEMRYLINKKINNHMNLIKIKFKIEVKFNFKIKLVIYQ